MSYIRTDAPLLTASVCQHCKAVQPPQPARTTVYRLYSLLAHAITAAMEPNPPDDSVPITRDTRSLS